MREKLKEVWRNILKKDYSEATAEILGNLINDQEFLNELARSNPSLFKRLYAWVNELWYKATGDEKAFLRVVKAKFEIAAKELSEGKVEKNSEIEYNNVTERKDFSKALTSKEWYVFYKKIDNHGLEQKRPGSKNVTFVNDKIILSEHDGTKPNIYDVYEGNIFSDEIAKKIGLQQEDIIQDIYEIAEEENVDERKIERSLEKYFKEGLLRRYDSDNNVFVSENKYSRTNVGQGIENIGNKSKRRNNLSRINQTNRELDSSSFLNEKQYEIIQKLIKDGKIKEIFTGSNYQQTSLSTNNISQTPKNNNFNLLSFLNYYILHNNDQLILY